MEQQIGRVALRHEGKWWCAYFTKNDTMDGAVMLSKMSMKPAESEPKVKEAFIQLNRLIVADAFAQTQGQTPTWKEPTPAPASELEQHAKQRANLAIERAVTDPSQQADEEAARLTDHALHVERHQFHGAIDRAWRSWKMMAMAADVSDLQSRDCEMAFKAGAATLFWSLMKVLDPGEEPTDADLAKMADLSEEIEAFSKTFDQRFVDRVKEGKP